MFSSAFLEFVLKKQTPETLNTPLVVFVVLCCVVCVFMPVWVGGEVK